MRPDNGLFYKFMCFFIKKHPAEPLLGVFPEFTRSKIAFDPRHFVVLAAKKVLTLTVFAAYAFLRLRDTHKTAALSIASTATVESTCTLSPVLGIPPSATISASANNSP